MELRSMIEIFFCLLIPLAMSRVIFASNENRFVTLKCDHNQLAPAVGKAMTCETEIWNKYLEKMLKQYKDGTKDGRPLDLVKGCSLENEMITKGKRYPLDLASSCLPDYIENFVDQIHDAIQLNCDCKTMDSACLLDGKKLNDSFASLVKSCKEDDSCPYKLLTFDKTCKSEERIGQLQKSYTCLATPFLQFQEEIGKYININFVGRYDPCKIMMVIRVGL